MSHSLEEVHGSNFVLQSYILQKISAASTDTKNQWRTGGVREKRDRTRRMQKQKSIEKEKIEIKKKGKDDRRDEGFATLFLDPYIFQLRK